jgi:hypothetical protein
LSKKITPLSICSKLMLMALVIIAVGWKCESGGRGPTFKIFLPAAQVEATNVEGGGGGERIRGGNETIFVVEAEPALRELVSPDSPYLCFQPMYPRESGAALFGQLAARGQPAIEGQLRVN